MQIGIGIPPATDSSELLFQWARQVDAGPFSTLGVLDRVAYPNYEPLITLAAAAALTTRVRLMTEVLISPIRNTIILAKECATLDAISKGRLTLGLGIGGREDDYTAAGATFKQRGKHLEEQLSQMKSIWAGHSLNAVGPIGPQPVQTGGPKLLLGGFATSAIQRVARYADGFITAMNNIEQIDKMFRIVEQAWQDAGRSGKPHLVAQIDTSLETRNIGQGLKSIEAYYSITPQFLAGKVSTLVTTDQQITETIQALKQIGTDEVIFFPWSTEIDQIDRIANIIK